MPHKHTYSSRFKDLQCCHIRMKKGLYRPTKKLPPASVKFPQVSRPSMDDHRKQTG